MYFVLDIHLSIFSRLMWMRARPLLKKRMWGPFQLLRSTRMAQGQRRWFAQTSTFWSGLWSIMVFLSSNGSKYWFFQCSVMTSHQILHRFYTVVSFPQKPSYIIIHLLSREARARIEKEALSFPPHPIYHNFYLVYLIYSFSLSFLPISWLVFAGYPCLNIYPIRHCSLLQKFEV